MSKNNKGLPDGYDKNLKSQKDGSDGVEAQSCYELPPTDVCGRPILPIVFQFDRLDFTTVADGPDYKKILQSRKMETPVTFMNQIGIKFTGVVVVIDFAISKKRGSDWIFLTIALGDKAVALFSYNTKAKFGGEITVLMTEKCNV